VPDIFHELKLPPSFSPIGIAILKVCNPGVKSLRIIISGIETEPGHQFDLLKSEEVKPLPKFPEAGFNKRKVAQSSRQGINL